MTFLWLHFIEYCPYFSATRLGHFSARQVTRVAAGGDRWLCGPGLRAEPVLSH